MFKLNELIMIKASLSTSLGILDEVISATNSDELKALRTERFEALLTLHKKVDNQATARANFGGEG